MSRFDSPLYDDCRIWIQKKQEKGIDWPSIRLACKNDTAALAKFLLTRKEEDDWPMLSVDDWTELVEECEEYLGSQQDIKFRGNDGALFDRTQDNGLRVPENPRSCWQLYKNGLNWKEDSIQDLEDATIGILKRLSTDTRDTGAIKGLVIGHVQSGKTANMEALMAMAADHGWNMFIVLSGTIENLRLQRLKRMQNDLNREGNLIWRGFEHPSKSSQYGERARDFHFEDNAQSRYFTVCLKNASRLRKLIDWIHADKAAHDKMRILIIDDEADQASVSNTATEYAKAIKERKGINKLIVDLVEDRHHKEGGTKGSAIAINYVMYTATPYANFLNECSEESLYPRDFIWTLKTSNEYLGPNQIFGTTDPDSDGLGIVRSVVQKDLDDVADLYSGTSKSLPLNLKNAICWFICATAVMRYWNYKKPISMLVHTSQKQDHHEVVSDAISLWFNTTDRCQLIKMCKEVYEEEIAKTTKDRWLANLPNYGIPGDQIRNYPDYSKIAKGVELLLAENIKHIKMTDEGDLQYHAGLHLVIDNCSKNGIQKDNDYVRLAYPDPDTDPYPSPAPAFIIVGGSTLSRGLTIEGLVSTFFLRASCQADTLMQMGRWFGYRKGYELLPRIWMTVDTTNKFRFLSQLEIELREDLKKYMITDVSPIDYGPRIKVSPKVSWLRLTSRNHMRNAVPAEMDFSGAKPQTVVFDNNQATQEKNLAYVEDFLSKLPGAPGVSHDNRALVWKNVPLSTIMEELLIDKFSFSSRARAFNEIDAFCSWIQQVVDTKDLNNWSVIVAGSGEIEGPSTSTKRWNVANYSVGKINRSKRSKSSNELSIDIGVLRALKDCIADVDGKYVQNFENTHGHGVAKQSHVDEIRKDAGMLGVPQLIVYLIDKDSRVLAGNSDEREALGTTFDIVGLHICVPGEQVNAGFTKRLTIRLPEKDKEDEVEDIT